MSIVIRAMAPTDIPAARLLSAQLGYELNANEVERRYNAVKERGVTRYLLLRKTDGLSDSSIYMNGQRSTNRQK